MYAVVNDPWADVDDDAAAVAALKGSLFEPPPEVLDDGYDIGGSAVEVDPVRERLRGGEVIGE